MSTKVSVVIPVYNGEVFIRDAIYSCLGQSYLYEIIVVDDGSTDASLERAQTIIDSRLKCFSIKNSGAANARNFGVSKASGDYIAFLDADDYFLPGKVESQLDAMRSRNIEVSVSSIIVSDMKNASFSKFQKKVFTRMNRFWKKTSIFGQFLIMNTPTLIVSRQLYEKVGGFDVNLRTREDHKFLIEALSFSDLMIHENYHVVRRVNLSSLSNSFDVSNLIDNELAFIESFDNPHKMHVGASILSLFKIILIKRPSSIFNRKLWAYYYLVSFMIFYFLIDIFLRFLVKKND